MKYGEAYVASKDSLKMVGGKWQAKKFDSENQMTRDEAFEYYNAKLETYWLESLCDKIPVNKREKSLHYLLGRIS